MNEMEKTQLLGMTPDELAAYLKALGQPAFRAKQVFSWLHQGAAFEQMSNLPKALRETRDENCVANPVSVLETIESKLDGTIKLLYRLPDGNVIEGVLMRYKYGNTLCLSTQVGCRMGCAFCASTLDGCARNLTPAEMLGQIVCANGVLAPQGQKVGNIVLMGSGEPLDNYDNVVAFLNRVTAQNGLRISARNVSVSTCGIVPRIDSFIKDAPHVTLSISLHAHDDETRTSLMPVNRAYPIGSVLASARRYAEKTGRRVVFEYALIDGVNATIADADALSARLRGMLCHVNLIPLNPVSERGLSGVSREDAQKFCDRLTERKISATVRREMGTDIDGACGQLRRRILHEIRGEN